MEEIDREKIDIQRENWIQGFKAGQSIVLDILKTTEYLNEEQIEEIEDLVMDLNFKTAVKNEIQDLKEKGIPIARYDIEKKEAFLEYADGHREYIQK